MLHSRDDNEDHVDLPSFPEDTEAASLEVPDMPDSQAEFLQGQSRYLAQQRNYFNNGENCDIFYGFLEINRGILNEFQKGTVANNSNKVLRSQKIVQNALPLWSSMVTPYMTSIK